MQRLKKAKSRLSVAVIVCLVYLDGYSLYKASTTEDHFLWLCIATLFGMRVIEEVGDLLRSSLEDD